MADSKDKLETGLTKIKNLHQQGPSKEHEFEVRVHVIEARDLKPQAEDKLCDPVCYINVMDKSEKTERQNDTCNCTWDHLMFFPIRSLASEFLKGKIIAQLYDCNTFFRNIKLGYFEFDIQSILEKPGQEIYRQWVGLMSDEQEGLRGYLKLSISILGPGDKPTPHNADEEIGDDEDLSEDATLQNLVLLPPAVIQTVKRIDVNIGKGNDFPKMDLIGRLDAYVSIKFGGTQLKTATHKNNKDPEFLERITLQAATPTLADHIQLQVIDSDFGSGDDIVATHTLSLQQIIQGRESVPNWSVARWINLYGTPEGTENEASKAKLCEKMNSGFIEGSAYRGRLLVSATAVNDPHPKVGVTTLTSLVPPRDIKYILCVDVHELSDLFKDDSYLIRVSWGAQSAKIKKTKVRNGSGTFYASVPEISAGFPADRSQVPDVFIEVMQVNLLKDVRVGYIRLPACALTSHEISQWSIVQPDIFTVGTDVPSIIGYLHFSAALGTVSEFGKRQPVAKPATSKMILWAHIFQASDLPAGDSEGTSDAYVIVRCGSASARSRVIKKTVAPQWHQTVQLECELPNDLSQAPNIQLVVMDQDTLRDDYLCRGSFEIKGVTSHMPEKPTWIPLFVKNPELTSGKLLASFQVVPANTPERPPTILPETKECIVEVSCIGVRGLLPHGLLPIIDPYVEISCLNKTLKFTKGSRGPDANFLNTQQMRVSLPLDPIFAPALNITVFDDRGMFTSQIATRTLPAQPFLPWSSKEEAMQELMRLQNKKIQPPATAPEPIQEELPSLHRRNKGPRSSKPSESHPPIVGLDDHTSGKTETDPPVIGLDEEHEEQEHEKNLQRPQFARERTLPDVEPVSLQGFEDTPDKKLPQRETLMGEYENFAEPPFGVYPLYRSRQRKNEREFFKVGDIKLKVRILDAASNEQKAPERDLKTLYAPKDYVVRVYCLEGFQLVPNDINGKVQPFLMITDGDQKVTDMQQSDKPSKRPQFNTCLEIKSRFPENSRLTLSVWDYDRLSRHDLIGETLIDLENRVFDPEWQQLKEKPIEWRTLWNPSSRSPQGQLKLWVEVLTPEAAAKTPKLDITPPKPLDFELRMIVWETAEVALRDSDMSDIFVTGQILGGEPQSTDTHWRSKEGEGFFNWRMVFPLTYPCREAPRCRVQLWDKDVINPDDAIGEVVINLRGLLKRAWESNGERQIIHQSWVQMTHPKASASTGKVLLSFDVMSAAEASRRPVGLGRKEPNNNPFLPEPHRPETSFSPVRIDKYIEQEVIGSNMGKIIAAGACLICCLIIIIVIILAAAYKFFFD